ncbi:hypothetical protein Hmuk_0873 [Halomicrobium mukohataei DSM 12286]|uniref:Uncharacterized protein n=1 Tax=Halomicrobium mukohataei (strain ATCC 700874 / DSM 12286 / JCM 9738 / NCIMB 13541) TaxID=485914 RepID=C7P0M1_HALMD|nr:hypothetical protein Hmuk_0873 [Halomicrobium mukohataei DSM 12286]
MGIDGSTCSVFWTVGWTHHEWKTYTRTSQITHELMGTPVRDFNGDTR